MTQAAIKIVLGGDALKTLFELYPEMVLEISKGAFRNVIERNFGDMWDKEIKSQIEERLFETPVYGRKRKPKAESRKFVSGLVDEQIKGMKAKIKVTVRNATLDQDAINTAIDERIATHVSRYMFDYMKKAVRDSVREHIDELVSSGELQPLILQAIIDSGVFNNRASAD